ncbi:MAG: InlB B-repeat-containing protein, partial [Lachnospiraceae bacterium]|nr:InlB B-repeat-containing protein [Lachnospiraceae bacterium]
DDYVNEKGNVKKLVADNGTKNITLYCVWKAHTYNVEFELSDNVSVRNGKTNIVNPKEYGKTYEDLDYDTSYFYWTGHDFMYWQIDRILDKDGIEIPGYLYDRATMSEAAYKNLTDIDGATVVLKVIWSGIKYKIHFDNAIPEGAEIIEENAPIEDVVLYNETELIAPQVNVAIKRYAFRGWDLNSGVATPSYAVGDIIQGLATYENQEITLYGIWHETKSGSVDPWDPDDPTPADDPIASPSEPHDTDEDENPFLYYIIDSYSDMETGERTYEDGMNEAELLAKFGGDVTLHEALGVHLKDDTLYVRYPIYDNVYTIEIEKNIPKEADSRDEFFAESMTQNIYEGDRVRLFDDTLITLDGYKLKGFTSKSMDDPVRGEVEYYVGDIVRKYREETINAGGLVKRLYADEDEKKIKLYCLWEPNTYSIEYDKGNENVGVRYDKDPNNIKIYGETYKDLTVDRAYMVYEGHEFMFWEVYEVRDASGNKIDGHRVRRATYSSTDGYKNLSPLDKSTVVLRAVWSKTEYNIAFDDNIPIGGEVVVSSPLDSIHVNSADMIKAPFTNTVVRGYSFLGWDLDSDVEIPTYKAGEDYIYGLGFYDNEVITLHGIWQEVEAYVVIPEDKGGSGEKIDILEEVDDPVAPYNYDNGNEFLYYIIASISDVNGNVRNEEEMNNKELLAKFGGDKTLADALGNQIVNGSTYEGLPIYRNEYTIKLEGNVPSEADSSTYKVSGNEQKIYENDRVELFKDTEVSLKGYKLLGFARNSSGSAEYKALDIVRKYKGVDTNSVNNVKELYANEANKVITLYCVWEPIKYYVAIDLGVDNDPITKLTAKSMALTNPKYYNRTYNDLYLNSAYRNVGHSFVYWIVDSVKDKDGNYIDGYLYDRTIIAGNFGNADYKNLIDIDEATVYVKAIWQTYYYTINFEISTPSEATVLEYGDKVDSVVIKNDDKIKAPYVDSVLDGWTFLGWDRNKDVKIPTFKAGESDIVGLGRDNNGSITLYGIWSKVTSKVVIEGEIDEYDINESLPNPAVSVDSDGREFLYYIIGSISDADKLIREEDMIEVELLAKFGGRTGKTLQDAIGSHIKNNAVYYAHPIYNNMYDIVVNVNKPSGANEGDEVEVKNNLVKVALDDRNYLLEDLEMTIPGYRLKGLSSITTGEPEYKVSDIVRIYKDGDTNLVNNVKELYANTIGKSVPLYAIWEPISYYVAFDIGTNNANLISQKTTTNPKVYGVSYNNELSVNSNYRYQGHNFRYWVVDKVYEGATINSSGYVVGGEEVLGYRYNRSTYSVASSYKNLTNINGATVVLKAVWENQNYTLSFNENRPSGAVVVREGEALASRTVNNGDIVVAPMVDTILNGYEFKGWDLKVSVSTPAFAVGNSIYGIGRGVSEEITLYGVWGKVSAKVKTPTGVSGAYEIKEVTEEVENPKGSRATSDLGNNFLYYIIDDIDLEDGVKEEGEMSEVELMAKFGGI